MKYLPHYELKECDGKPIIKFQGPYYPEHYWNLISSDLKWSLVNQALRLTTGKNDKVDSLCVPAKKFRGKKRLV